jgi:hypothetical protein
MKIYEEEEPVEETQLKTAENRRWFRTKCDIETRCDSVREQWPCKVVDVSQDGLGIVSTRKLSAGEVISLHEPRAIAEVVWSEGGRAGLKIKKQS